MRVTGYSIRVHLADDESGLAGFVDVTIGPEYWRIDDLDKILFERIAWLKGKTAAELARQAEEAAKNHGLH